ncbi:MAG: hypothetical protein ACYC24_08780 [Desulfobacteria bacterium]
MATKRARRTRNIRTVPLTAGQEHYLATGELTDFSSFQVCGGRDPEADRKEFEAIRRGYKPGAFPWAEKKFSGAAE